MTGRHRDFLPILLGVLVLLTAVGVVNDEAIARLSPQHFNVFYPSYFPLHTAWKQALCFALVAAGWSGFVWGTLLYWVGHYGPGPVVRPRATLLWATAVALITIFIAWALGWHTWATGIRPYKDFFYPSADSRLVLSQTVQLTNEFAGLGGAGLLLATMAIWRWLHRDRRAAP